MSLESRLAALEHQMPRRCLTCAAWTLRVETLNEVPSPYELEQQRRRFERDGPGPREWPPACPACGREIPGVVLCYEDERRPAPNSLAAHLLGLEAKP